MTQDVKKIIKIGSLCLFFIIIFAYALFQAHDLVLGVKITNVDIADGTKVTNNIINVTGNAENATSLTLDGRVISVDQNGNFSETIALLSGYNIISMRAVDKFGHEDDKNYQLIYND